MKTLFGFLIIINLSGCAVNIRSKALLISKAASTDTSVALHVDRQLVTGASHECFIDSDSSVKCWGDNSYGQIKTPDHWSPGDVSGLTPATSAPSVSLNPYTPGTNVSLSSFSVGGASGCAILSGKMLCWGQNSLGQWGVGSASVTTNSLFREIFSSGATQVSVGSENICSVVSGAVYCSGSNAAGQIGDGISAPYVDTHYQLFSSGGTKVSVRYQHGCAIVSGALFCWGWNGNGEVGDGTSGTGNYAPTPVQIFASGVSDFSVGNKSSCAVESGALKCWGINDHGQVGNGVSGANVLSKNTTIFGSGVTAVSLGYQHACAIVSGALYCWGANDHSQVGNGVSGADVLTPTQIYASGVTAVATGTASTCAIVSGALKCWGRNNVGQMGNSTLTSTTTHSTVFASGVTDVSMNNLTVCAMVSGGLKCWGYSSTGQTGAGASPTIVTTPYPIMGSYLLGNSYANNRALDYRYLASGYNHTCLVEQSGGQKCWGDNTSQQIGYNGGATTHAYTPYSAFSSNVSSVATSYAKTYVLSAGGLYSFGQTGMSSSVNTFPTTTLFTSGVSAVTAGYANACAIVEGTLQCWGQNGVGQIGIGLEGGTFEFPQTVFDASAGVQAVSAGYTHLCAILAGGELKCWGYSGYGQVGTGVSVMAVSTPTTVIASGVTAIATGDNHTCAVVAGGLKCWGQNTAGAIGNGTTSAPVYTPYDVFPASSGVTAVSAGNDFTCAIVSGGLQCWGSNSMGNVGNGTALNQVLSPATIFPAGSGVTEVSAGRQHVCAVVSGTLKCWGDLSVWSTDVSSSTTTVKTPLSIFSSGATKGAAGGSHTCIIVSGSLRCWGMNSTGAVGDPSRHSSIGTPFTVFASGVEDVAAGVNHTCAIVSGALYCFGANDAGQIGYDSSGASVFTPYLAIPSGVVRVYAAGYTTCALKTDDQIYCFGLDYGGVLNDGDTNYNSIVTPTAINMPSGTLVDFSMGYKHTCGIFNQSGTNQVICWGSNEDGAIVNDGIFGAGIISETISAAVGATQILVGSLIDSGSSGRTCFIQSDVLKCFGEDNSGYFGVAPTNSPVLTPFTVESGPVILASARGSSHICALVNDTVRCSGHASEGTLGPSATGFTASEAVLTSVGP